MKTERFVQITALPDMSPDGTGSLFALDAAGDVWEFVAREEGGRDRQGWEPLSALRFAMRPPSSPEPRAEETCACESCAEWRANRAPTTGGTQE